MLCPNCRKLISVDEPRCPYCGTVRPGLWGYGPALAGLFGGRVDLVAILMGACVLLFVLSIALDPAAALRPARLFDVLSPSSRALYQLGMTGGYAHAIGAWWTILTAIYLHGGPLHILFNVMWIRDLGRGAEDVFGPARFFVIWTAAGAGGFVLSNALGAAPTIGASGSIFGLLGAMIAHSRRRGSSLGGAVSRQMIQWAVILFLFGFAMRGVNNLAHLGGFATGFLLGRVLPGAGERREGRSMQMTAMALLLATIVAFTITIVRNWGLSQLE
jgi:rhomboid protease GluP